MGAIFIVGRGLVLTVRVETPHARRRIRAHPTWQLDRVFVALSAHTRKGPIYLCNSLLLPTLVTACLGRFTV